MRSSRSATDDPPVDLLDPGPAGFAHRGFHGPGVPENSLAAFEAALAIGAGIECDVRLSADGKAVVFHDSDLRRLCASGLRVEAAPAGLLVAQRLFGTGQRIPLLADLIDLTAGRVPLLIELKCHGGNADRLAAAVAADVGARHAPVGVMSFEPRAVRWFARNRADLRRGLVISRRSSSLARWNAIRACAPHFLAVDRAALASAWVARQRTRRRVYSWTIRTAGERETARVHADALIWEADGRP
ncbi:MAG TPA: glycerophosphodiester phosphodiesterase family protein [Sphingomicrobium sp.]|nr:glycerophosphodiester phosphodiesterase family protein [Sphingomicrobium sp.]